MSVLNEVLAANEAYAADFGAKSELALPPARGFAILTCMDARLDPAKYAGLAEGDAHVIRNAGGRASDDAIRSLVISYKLLGTKEWFVIHHSDCGMEFFTDEVIRGLLRRRHRPWLGRGEVHRLANHLGAGAERYRGCCPHQESPTGSCRHSCLRLHLRREDWSPSRGSFGYRSWRG